MRKIEQLNSNEIQLIVELITKTNQDLFSILKKFKIYQKSFLHWINNHLLSNNSNFNLSSHEINLVVRKKISFYQEIYDVFKKIQTG